MSPRLLAIEQRKCATGKDHFLFFSEHLERLFLIVHPPFLFLSMVYIKPRHLFHSLKSLSLLRSLRYQQEEAPRLFGLRSRRPRVQFGLLLHRFLSQANQSGWNNKISQLTNISTWKGVKLNDENRKLAGVKLLSSVSSGRPIFLPWRLIDLKARQWNCRFGIVFILTLWVQFDFALSFDWESWSSRSFSLSYSSAQKHTSRRSRNFLGNLIMFSDTVRNLHQANLANSWTLGDLNPNTVSYFLKTLMKTLPQLFQVSFHVH